MTDLANRPGRKRDPTRDAQILDAALRVLADSGYHGMTIDLVAAKAGAARATVYRRWATKAELVVDAVRHMSRSDIDPTRLPDTGTLRGDMVASIAPHTIDDQLLRIRVLSGLHSLAATEPRIADAATGEGAAPWIEANRALLRRSIERGEFAPREIDTLASVIPMMCMARIAIEQQPITREFSIALIDDVILPAMRGATQPTEKAHP